MQKPQMIKGYMSTLPQEGQRHLKSLNKTSSQNEEGRFYPLVRKSATAYIIIQNCILPESCIPIFENSEKTNDYNLYRAGVSIFVKVRTSQTQCCYLAVHDNRHNYFRAIGGIAQLASPECLMQTAIKEVTEELCIYDAVAEKKRKIYNPVGCESFRSKSLVHGFYGTGVMTGSINLIGYYTNPLNRALEAVYIWDITEIQSKISVAYEEPYPKTPENSLWGNTVFGISEDSSKILGLYNGQAGFLPFSKKLSDNEKHPIFKSDPFQILSRN